MLASVPDYAAAALIEGTGLRADDPPFPIQTSELSMVWSSVTDHDPAEHWLRRKIAEHMTTP
jgi:LysR family transcriptional activator of mexEF-oprN operon